MDNESFARQLEEAALAHYLPPTRAHAREWLPPPGEKRFLGVSTLVKQTAQHYARYLMERPSEEDDPVSRFYTMDGNETAKLHLGRITQYQEIQVRVPIPDFDYDLVGHMDGITFVQMPPPRPAGWHAIAEEHKHKDAFDPDEPGGSVDLAERQVALYLAMFAQQLGCGVRLFPKAPWEHGNESLNDLNLDFGEVSIWGIRVHFWPRSDPKPFVRARAIDAVERAAIFEHYLAKARCILRSVEAFQHAMNTRAIAALNPESAIEVVSDVDAVISAALACEGGARSWDLGPNGVVEFRRTMRSDAAGIDSTGFYVACTAKAEAQSQIDKWTTIKKKADADALLFLAQSGQKSLDVVDTNGSVIGKATAALASTGSSTYLKFTQRTVKP